LKCGSGEGWRRLENVSWIERVKNEEVLHRFKEELRYKQVNEGKIEGRMEATGRQGRRQKQLRDDINELHGAASFLIS
jgi:hypothetical protein